MIKKRVLKVMAALFLCSQSIFAASMRDYVCVVKGQYSQEKETFLKNYAEQLKVSAYKDYGEYIESFLSGTFGSGFIYYASNGKPYIITNNHVVSDYQSVTITFDNEDGSTSEYKDLKILAANQDIDLAIIELPSSFKKDGILISEKKYSDGDEVYSAGFPGLAGNPSWQLGKGIISNSSAKIKELLDPAVSSTIQHTAEIDSGNSGGPLLIKDSGTASGYRFIGVNTWKVRNRQNTNFAIPASLVKKFVEDSLKPAVKQEIKTVNSEFIKTLSNKEKSFSSISKYVSYEMIEKYGDSAFRQSLARADTEHRAEIAYAFQKNPLTGLRYALAYQIMASFYDLSDEPVFLEPETVNYEEDPIGYKVSYIRNEDKKYDQFLIWTESDGQLKIYKASTILTTEEKEAKHKQETKGKVYFSVEDPYLTSITGGYSLTDSDAFYGLNFSIIAGYKFLFMGLEINTESVLNKGLLSYGAFLRAQCPLLFNSYLLEPFIQAGGGMAQWDDFCGYGFIEAGLETGLATTFNGGYCVGIKYRLEIFGEPQGFEQTRKSVSNSAVIAFVSIKIS